MTQTVKSFRDNLFDALVKTYPQRVVRDGLGSIAVSQSNPGRRASVIYLLAVIHHVASDMRLSIPDQRQAGQFRLEIDESVIIVDIRDRTSDFLLSFTEHQISQVPTPA